MKRNLFLSLIIILGTISMAFGQNPVVTYPAGPFTTLLDGDLVGADYWSDEPQILSAGLGFCDIVGLPTDILTEDIVQQAGGTWLSDIDCDTTNVGSFTLTTTQQQVGAVYILQTPYGELKDGAMGLDGLPIVFSWPVLTNTIDLTDFQITLNTGEIVTPLAASSWPNLENNERNCVVVFAEFGNRLPSSDPNARFPVKCEIVADDTPLTLVGPNNQLVSAVGLSWETDSSPYDENNGPRLVGAKLNYVGDQAIGEGVSNSFAALGGAIAPNSEFDLYGGGDFRLRMLTTGGFSPDGVRGVLPTDYERFFRIHVRGENGDTVLIEQDSVDYQVLGGTLRVIGLSDLGAVEGGDYFINYAYFNYIAYQNFTTNYLISKANFDINRRYSGSDIELPRVNTPVVPFSYGEDYPAPYYADCTTPIADEIPDLRGDWIETTVTINGEAIVPQSNPRQERIEQCGNRILIASDGVLHEVFVADSTMFNGVNDVDPTAEFPVHLRGRFKADTFILTPVLTDTTQVVPDITRTLIQDDDGFDVIRLFNPMLGGTRYLREEVMVSTNNVTLSNNFKVAPNPFQNQTLITWNNTQNRIYQAQLFNATGQVVRTYQNIMGESLLIEKKGLLPGIYFLSFVDDTGNLGILKLSLL